MITSLNVNNFVGQEEWTKLQGKSIEKTSIWNKEKDYYFNYIMKHLISDDDVVILHEVPYIKEKSYIDKFKKIKFKRIVKNEADVKDEHKSDIYKNS